LEADFKRREGLWGGPGGLEESQEPQILGLVGLSGPERKRGGFGDLVGIFLVVGVA